MELFLDHDQQQNNDVCGAWSRGAHLRLKIHNRQNEQWNITNFVKSDVKR